MYKDYDGNWNDAPCDIEMGSICEFGATADRLCHSQKTEGMFRHYEIDASENSGF